jgi:Amt family ammonium transporter
VTWAVAGRLLVYGTIKATLGLRLSQEDEFDGADIAVHKISSSAEREANW